MNRIRIHHRQRRHPVDAAALRTLARALLQRAARLEPSCAGLTVDLVLVDDAACVPINRAAVGHEGPTDVITLRYEAVPGETDGETAEIILNAECAWRQGGDRAGADRELALYLAHACDHLCGFDDQTPAARRAMRRREWRWLSRVGVPVLFAGDGGTRPARRPAPRG
jgi:rRNA maturation RNase YbeY